MKYNNAFALVLVLTMFVSLISFAYAAEGDVADSQTVQEFIEERDGKKFANDNSGNDAIMGESIFSTIGGWFSNLGSRLADGIGTFYQNAVIDTAINGGDYDLALEEYRKMKEEQKNNAEDAGSPEIQNEVDNSKILLDENQLGLWDRIKGWAIGKCYYPDGTEGDWMEIRCSENVEQTFTKVCTGGSWVNQPDYKLCLTSLLGDSGQEIIDPSEFGSMWEEGSSESVPDEADYVDASYIKDYDCTEEGFDYQEFYPRTCQYCGNDGKWQDACNSDQECVVDSVGNGICTDVSGEESFGDIEWTDRDCENAYGVGYYYDISSGLCGYEDPSILSYGTEEESDPCLEQWYFDGDDDLYYCCTINWESEECWDIY